MPQQFLALLIIIFFILRIFSNRTKNLISSGEFAFWMIFWGLSALAVIFIRQIDRLVSFLGFSAGGINFLSYLAVIILFYFVFRIRLDLLKVEKNITEIVRKIAVKECKNENQNKEEKNN